eukprot:3413001-Prymnesium_polylepis.1
MNASVTPATINRASSSVHAARKRSPPARFIRVKMQSTADLRSSYHGWSHRHKTRPKACGC